MKQFFKVLSATWFMGGLFIVLAVAMAVATFIENDYGTNAARSMVYNAWWFEFIFLLLAVNMVGNILTFRMWKLEKAAVLLFHVSFFVIIIGAGVTRYFSEEGLLMLREGESKDYALSMDSYVTFKVETDDETTTVQRKVNFSAVTPYEVSVTMRAKHQKLRIKSVAYAFDAVPKHEGVIMATSLNAVVFEVLHNGDKHNLVVYGKKGVEGNYFSLEFDGLKLMAKYGSVPMKLPFSVRLNKFVLERYAGSNSPSGYVSEISVIDDEHDVNSDYSIFMNNILSYGGYRFYQSSYDLDEKGTVLSVNRDRPGTIITYFGYFLMTLGMMLALLIGKSRFRWLQNNVEKIYNQRKELMLLLVLALSVPIFANSQYAAIAPQNGIAEKFGSIWVQDNGGRIKPLNTLHTEIVVKLVKHNTFTGLTADQVILGMFTHPRQWQQVALITVKDEKIRQVLGVTEKKASYIDFFDDNMHYKLHAMADAAHRKSPAERSKTENEVVKIDEQVNLFHLTQNGRLHKVFPSGKDLNLPWYTPTSNIQTLMPGDSIFVRTSVVDFIGYVLDGDYSEASKKITEIVEYQQLHSEAILPSQNHLRMELLYNRLNVFMWLATFFFVLGIVLVLIQFLGLLWPQLNLKIIMQIGFLLLLGGFIYQTFGLGLRWFIAGHAPWSNGYESMIFSGWAIMFAGILLSRKTIWVLPISGLFTGIVLMVAHLSWMNPQITNLVPVLQSYWLTLHVSVIIAGYGFLALGALLGLMSLIIISLQNSRNLNRLQLTVDELTSINEMSVTVGLYLMTIGSFLGGVWANESWGRYWGWDPKETWSLITIVLYAFVLHMRFIPGMKGSLAFNTASIITFGSVIMTYLGVNYYLAGLHSYAGGDSVPIPMFVYYSLAVIGLLILVSRVNEFRLKKGNHI